MDLQQELGIFNETSQTATCHIYLIHHGSTEWSEQSRLQGWNHLPLSKQGKERVQSLADRIRSIPFSGIYSSPLQSALESSTILQKELHCPIIEVEAFRGEFHGNFEGFTKEQYTQESHFQYYVSLPPNEEIFYPCGKGGESKADVARRVIVMVGKNWTEKSEK